MTSTELVTCWNYLQTSYIPSLRIARYVFKDNIDKIKENKKFYRQETKKEINSIEHDMELLCCRTIDTDADHIRWINIFCDNIDEVVEKDIDNLATTIKMEFQRAMVDTNLDFFIAIHLIDYALMIAGGMFHQCCKDLDYHSTVIHDSFETTESQFALYNPDKIQSRWENICDKSMKFIPRYNSERKRVKHIALNKQIHEISINCITRKLTSIETIRDAMEKSYPYSHFYSAIIPYEESRDYAVVHGGKTKSGKVFTIREEEGKHYCICCGKEISTEDWLSNKHKCKQCKP